MPDLDDLTLIQQEKFDGSLYLGKEIGVAARLMAIHVSSTGTQILHLDDDEPMQFGSLNSDGDVALAWDGSNLELLPAVDDTGAFNIGDGTTDMDFKWFGGKTTSYVQMNVDTSPSAGQGLPAGGKLRVRTTEAAGLGAGGYAGVFSTYETTASQVLDTSCFAVWGDFAITGDIAFYSNCAGVWGHLRITDGGGAVTTGRDTGSTETIAYAAGVAASVQTTDGYVCNTGHVVCALRADSAIHASATLTGAAVALEIDKGATAKAWTYGIRMQAGAATTGIYLGTTTTGISIGACTTGLDVTGLISSQVIDYTTETSVGETTDAHLIRYGTSAAPIVYTPTSAGSHSGIQLHITAADAPTGLSLAGIRSYVTYTGTAKATAYGGLFWVNLNTDSYTGDYIGGTPAGVQGVMQCEGTVAAANDHAWYCGVAGEVRPLGTITKVGVISAIRAVMNCNTTNVVSGVLAGVHVGAYNGTVDTGVLVLPHVGSTFTTGLHLDSQYGTITTGITVGACTTGMTITAAATAGITISGAGTNAISITQTGSVATDGTCLKIGTSTTPITSGTSNAGAFKCYSDNSGTNTWLVGGWFRSYITSASGTSPSVYALRGEAGLATSAVTASGASYIIGVHGRWRAASGTINNSAICAGVLAQWIDGGTYTSVSHAAALWVDCQNAQTVSSGNTEMVYITHNGSAAGAVDHVFYIYAGNRITNLMKIDTASGMVSATAASAVHGTSTKKIKIDIDGTTYYLLASTVPTT